MIHHGDCLDVMAAMEPESVDAIVTDPPYLLQFMGKTWDSPTKLSGHATPDAGTVGFYQAVGKGGRHDGGMDNWRPNLMGQWHEAWARAAYRVAKPSAYLLAFGGTRTVHRMTVALEDAGWIIRDMLVWAYASGFPKSKASLKPAWEPIVMARKPGPLRELAIDACRIGEPPEERGGTRERVRGYVGIKSPDVVPANPPHESGRWPANVILTDPIFDGGCGTAASGGEPTDARGLGGIWHPSTDGVPAGPQYGDSGTYSRFFLIPKADRADREPVLGGLEPKAYASGSAHKRCAICGKQEVNVPGSECQCEDPEWVRPETTRTRANVHPTVKPTDLMRHLVRLVTPAGGLVLDPFLGSGTTGLACELEGFPWVGIEREEEYVAIAEARLNGTQRGLGLVG